MLSKNILWVSKMRLQRSWCHLQLAAYLIPAPTWRDHWNDCFGWVYPVKRQAVGSTAELLKRALPALVFQQFGQVKPIPKSKSATIKFRRYPGSSDQKTKREN